MITDRLPYLKHIMDIQKKSRALVLRRSDGEWIVSEIERLRKEALKEDRLLKQGKFEVSEHG